MHVNMYILRYYSIERLKRRNLAGEKKVTIYKIALFAYNFNLIVTLV